MKKKLLISLVLFTLVTTISVAMNLNETKCTHSHEGHDCTEHLAQAKSLDNQCPNCFRYPDEYGLCPLCDYEMCPICNEWKLIKDTNYCTKCNDRNPENTCPLCGKLLKDCRCDD